MKRLILSLTVLLLMAALLTACGGGSGKQPLPSSPELAQKLMDSGVFSDTLEAADPDIAAYLYGFTEEDGVEIHSWFSSSGVTAEELTLFVCKDDTALSAARKSADARLEVQKSTFSNYVPAEVPKLEGAIVRTRDKVLVVCVAADPEKAAKLLAPYFPA